MQAQSPSEWLDNALKELGSIIYKDHGKNAAHFKEFWKHQRKLLLSAQQNEDSGAVVSRALTQLTDIFIERLFEETRSAYKEKYGIEWSHPISIVALGGYGRQELAPFSDIDLLILYPQKLREDSLKEFLSVLNEHLVYPLWDLNFKVSNICRTITQTIEEARKDFRTLNAQIEARLVCGSSKLFRLFQKSYKAFLAEESLQEYLKHCAIKDQSRHHKFSDTVFLQEPNIKNGVGGLRDLHTLLWISQFQGHGANLDSLTKKGILSNKEAETLSKAYDFLLKVRNVLHLDTMRSSDLLNLEKQSTIAELLGYTEEDLFKRVEAFMHDYYQHAKAIAQIAELTLERLKPLSENQLKRFSLINVIDSCRSKRKKHIDGFTLCNNTFSFTDPNVFIDSPARLIRIFRHCQQYHATLSPELKSLIQHSLHLINEKLTVDPSACKSFRSILQTIGEVYPTLTQMHELGVLSRFIPEFEEITCLVQHEHYHRYTADIHTLNAIKELDQVFDAKTPELKDYAESIRSTIRPSLLYLIILLHDIGKGRGIKNHAQSSVEIAKPILDRLGINSKQQDIILFIIQHHLSMSRCWQRFDVDDPDVAASFATLLSDSEHLKYLFVLTYCDTNATAAGIWNSFKEMLHTKLYKNTLDVFSIQEADTSDRKQKKKDIYTQILKEHNPSLSDDETQKVIQCHPERYFILTNPEEMKKHTEMIDELNVLISKSDCSGSLMPVIDWKEDIDQSLTVITIVTWDRPGLFSSLAGAFAATGLNILSTKAFTRSDKITIDTFYVVEASGNNSSNATLKSLFSKKLRNIVVNDADPLPDIIQQAKRLTRSIPFAKKLPPRIADIPISLNVYYELSLNRTIVEVQCTDQVGLLYRISKAISDHGFDISFARIATEHGVANDTFHIQKNNIEESTGTNDLIDLREHLNEVLTPDPQFIIH